MSACSRWDHYVPPVMTVGQFVEWYWAHALQDDRGTVGPPEVKPGDVVPINWSVTHDVNATVLRWRRRSRHCCTRPIEIVADPGIETPAPPLEVVEPVT